MAFCEDCRVPLDTISLPQMESVEEFDAILCRGCIDNRREAAWMRQQEDLMSEPPMSLDEQHRRAWDEHQEAHRR